MVLDEFQRHARSMKDQTQYKGLSHAPFIRFNCCCRETIFDNKKIPASERPAPLRKSLARTIA